MPNWIPIDDVSSQIGYSGSWTVLKGSTRQWDGGVHSTTQAGASCVLRFKGVGISLRATVPAGSGNQVFEYKIDNRASVTVSTAQKSSDEYRVELLRVEDLPEAVHSITLTNRGAAPFQVDMLEYWPGQGDPNPEALFPLPVTPPTPRPTPTPTPTPRPQPVPQPQPQPQPQPSPRPSNPQQLQPDPDPPTSSERTRTIASPETQMITSTTTESFEGSEPSNGSPRSPSSSSSRASAGPRTVITTDENGLVINKIIPTATERMITTTDANGLVSTVTIVEAASTSGSSVPLGAIIGIAIGAVIAVLALLILVLFCRRKRKRERNAHYTAEAPQTQHNGDLASIHDGSVAARSSTQLISPYTAHSSENAPTPPGPVWRKGPIIPVPDDTYLPEHHRQPSSSASGAGFSTNTASGLSYTRENADASHDPPPAYRAPAPTSTEDTFSTASGMYGSEKQ